MSFSKQSKVKHADQNFKTKAGSERNDKPSKNYRKYSIFIQEGINLKDNIDMRNGAQILLLTLLLSTCSTPYPRILMETEMGDITLELYPDKAPVTAGNFLTYVDENRFEGAVFYRIVRSDNQPGDSIRIAVIQGGLYEDDHPAMLPPLPTRQPGRPGSCITTG